MRRLKNITYSILTILFIFTPGTASAASVSAQRRNIEQAPRYDKNAETILCASTGPSGVGTAIFNGSNNQQIAYNYFVSQGFSPQQSAGIVGNLIAESGVNPKRVQSTPTPSGDRDTITVDDKTGYGIAQWTSRGRQQGLVQFASNRGMSIQGDLPLQLDYLMSELNSTSYAAVLRALRAAPSLAAASSVFMTKFERPADQSAAAQEKRAGMGQKVFELYGNTSAPVVNPSINDPDEGPIPTSTPVVTTGGLPNGPTTNTACVNAGEDGADSSNTATPGFVGFPLQTTKARMTALNGGQLKDGVFGQSGHPYAAHDIMADPGTPVASILGGKVVGVSSDKCGGRLLAIYDQTQGVTVAYLHLATTDSPAAQSAAVGATIVVGQTIGYVGTSGNGCGSAHLHIDANTTGRRIGCKRESCSSENKALFQAGSNKIGLAKGLYDSYMKLP